MQNETRVVAPPPVLLVGGLALGAALELAFPFHAAASQSWRLAFGLPWGIAGLLFVLFAFQSLRKAGTTVSPFGGTTSLVRTGAYGISRNPIYVGSMLLYVSVAFVFGMIWALLLLPVVFYALDAGVVKREEAYLAERFGGEYLDYKRRVRRWL